MQHLDDFVSLFSKQLLKFDKLSDPLKYKHNLNQLFNILVKRKKFALDQELWNELYFYSIYMYPYERYLGNSKIPIVFVTKHNEILSFYMKKQIHKLNETIVRFDTHSDLNNIKNSIALPKLYEKYLVTKDRKYIDKAQEIVWDIGASKSGVLITTGIKDVVWGLPKWVPEKQTSIDFFIKKNKTQYTLNTISSNNNDLDFLYKETNKDKNKEYELKHYLKLQTGIWTDKTLEKIIKQIEKNSETSYILDVDLDYFICNGMKFDKSYHEEHYDLQSHDRTEKIVFNQDIPRNKNVKSEELMTYHTRLLYEIKKVNKRIKCFLQLLNTIKKQGYTPRIISVCDSTNVLFQDCQQCNTISNGYVPSHLALYVHTKVVSGLENLFC